ncbi:unnamed protein product, partial [Ectocarpus sp. 8 AP-2014]
LAVVSIAGPYRSGKSYFLNFLANHSPFPTSPTLNAEGGGGGACAKPLPDQEGTALLLLDTPGLMTPRR